MNYSASVTDFFASPRWGRNMLLSAVSTLIPFVGPIITGGWHISGLWARGDDRDPARFPDFNFEFFGKYLERGLWPFLVQLAASLALTPVIMVLVFLPMLTAVAGSQQRGGEFIPFVFFAILLVIYPIILLGFMLVLVPLQIRATITQGFGTAFKPAFVRGFIARTWLEIVLCGLFLLCLNLAMIVIAVITCYLGAFPALAVMTYSWHHLQRQLYDLYLSRGGDPVLLSPKLADTPPPLPGVPGVS